MSLKFEQLGYIRVGNKRGAVAFQPLAGEQIIYMDRSNRVFGNPYPMQNDSMQERLRVIDLFKTRLDEDFRTKGPMWLEANRLAHEIVKHKAKIICMCHCLPLPCHVQLIVEYIEKLVLELRLQPNKKELELRQSALF